jgi:hypothetical protein
MTARTARPTTAGAASQDGSALGLGQEQRSGGTVPNCALKREHRSRAATNAEWDTGSSGRIGALDLACDVYRLALGDRHRTIISEPPLRDKGTRRR